MSQKITILGTNVLKLQSGNALANRSEYICANSEIVSNNVPAPFSLTECFERFPNVKRIAQLIGVTAQFTYPVGAGGLSGSTTGVCLCPLAEEEEQNDNDTPPRGFTGIILGLTAQSKEFEKVIDLLGEEWLGCFWADPYAIFSSNCPDIGPMYEVYLQYRLGSGTFWYTPINAPLKRQQFVESIRDMVDITVGGNLSQRPGDIVYIKVDDATGLVSNNSDRLPGQSIKTGYYYILRAKNVIKNDGAHTTTLSLSKCTNPRFYPPYRGIKPYASDADVPSYGDGL